MNIFGVGEMGVGETGEGETGQIIGETGVGEMGVGETGTSQHRYTRAFLRSTSLLSRMDRFMDDIVSCPRVFNINITIRTGKPRSFMDGTKCSPLIMCTK